MQANEEKVSSPQGRTVWWIKRDFRVTDNHCLYGATQTSSEVIPFFCWEPSVIEGEDSGRFHLQAQWQALRGLSASLRKRGSGLVERVGEVVAELEALFRAHPFSCLRSYQETGNDLTFRRDLAVRAWCVRRGVKWIEPVGSTVVRGMSAEQKRKVLSKGPRGRMEVLPVPDDLCPPRDASIFAEPMEWNRLCSFFPKMGKPLLSSSLQTINERSAWDVLVSFLTERGAGYSGGISSPNSAFTSGSRLSAHLAWGTISTGSVFLALDQRREELSSDPRPSPCK